MTREELLGIFSANANVIRLKVIQFDSPSLADPLRMAVLQVEKWNDTGKIASRFISDGKQIAGFYLISRCDSLCIEILGRPLSIQASRHHDSVLTSESLVRELKQYGEIDYAGEEIMEEGILLHFKANSSYSYGDLTRSRSMRFGDDSISIDTLDEFLSEADFFGLLPHVQPKFKQVSQDPKFRELKELADCLAKSTIHAHIGSTPSVESLFKPDIINFDDNLSCLDIEEEEGLWCSTFEYDEKKIGSNFCLSFFSEKLEKPNIRSVVNLQSRTLVPAEPPAIVTNLSSLAPVEIRGNMIAQQDQVFTYPEVQNIIRSRPKPPKKEITKEQEKKALQKHLENTLEILAKLAKLGIEINKEFLASLLLRVDPSTKPQDLPKSFLKIVKTKFRKLKRREKKKTGKKGQAGSDSEDMESEDEENNQNQKDALIIGNPNEGLQGNSNFDGGKYPEMWLNFVSSLQPIGIESEDNPLEELNRKEEENPEFSPNLQPNQINVIPSEQINIVEKEESLSSLLHQIDQLDTSFLNYRLNFIDEQLKLKILSNFERRLQILQLPQ